MSLLDELKARGVVRATIAYLAVAWLALQLAEILFPAYGFGDAAIRNLVVLLGAGLVVVVAFSWLFEWTRRGIVREASQAGGARLDPSHPGRGHGLLNRFTVLVLALAVAFFMVDKFVLEPARDSARDREVAERARAEALQPSAAEPSIAVLPFRDLSPTGDQAYLSEGVAEELSTLLTRIPGLRVAGRASTVAVQGEGVGLKAIGERLAVAYVLDGSVSRAGERLRISAQLVDTATESQLWSERYDRALGDIFAVQDDIAARVVSELRVRLAGATPATRAISPAAYEQFLKARYLLYEFQVDEAEEVERLLRSVLDAEPDYAPALAQLWNLTLQRRLEMSSQEFEDDMEALLRRLLEADPDSPDTLYARAQWAFYGEGDPPRGIALLERALAADPGNLNVLRLAIYWLTELQQYDDAITVARRLVLREPACGRCFNALARAYRGSGRFEEGLQTFGEFAERGPVPEGFYWNRGVLALGAGDPQQALDDWAREPNDVGEVWRLMAIHDLGREAEFQARFAALREDYDHPESVARVYAYIGDADRAFEWLARMFEPGSEVGVTGVDTEIYDPIKSDPRWAAMMREHYGWTPDGPLRGLRLTLPPDLGG